MSFVLCIHTAYDSVDCALARDKEVLVASSINKEQASAQLIPAIDALLSIQHLRLSDLTHIIVNQGPAPFTTLRTIIATANGIAFAHKISLIGVDALDAFIEGFANVQPEPLVVLLNAFNKAVYYGITKQSNKDNLKGYAPIELCIQKIQNLFKDQQVHFIGNGSNLYRSEIEAAFGDDAYFQDPLPLTASLQQILNKGIDQLHAGKGVALFIEPLYLKKPLS
jgi:tRNA threonylcarbamoyladenosine biosynthesis protein TsaB